MKIGFRQGIVRYQTDINGRSTFLQRSSQDSQYIDLIVSPDPTIITFAQRDANYVFEETKTIRKAWGPFSGTTQYLYWDLNIVTAQLTRGFTAHAPIVAGVAPDAPAIDQHWFDTNEVVFKVWNGTRWIEKIRVFAATYSSGSIIRPFPLGSHIGDWSEHDSGNIVLDAYNNPLRQSDGTFLTSTAAISVIGQATRKVKIEAEIQNKLANEYIAKFNLVQDRPGRRVALARSNDPKSRVAGIALEDMYEGETAQIVTAGLIQSDLWNWPVDKVNRPVFCAPNGTLTVTPPTSGVLQQVGTIVDADAVMIRIMHPIVLDHPASPPTPPPPPSPGVPVADFTFTPVTGTAPLVVNFTSTSTGSPTLLEWDFTNNGAVDATGPTASYTYAAPGTYSVRLRAINNVGFDDEVKTNIISVNAAPPVFGQTNLEVRIQVDGKEDDQNITVKSGATFGVKVRVRNDGLLTATNVQRVFIVYDVMPHQVTVVTPPTGAVVSRVGNATQIVFAPIPSLTTGATVDFPPFVLRAPSGVNNRKLKMDAAVSSPEIDGELSDNKRSLTIEVRS